MARERDTVRVAPEMLHTAQFDDVVVIVVVVSVAVDDGVPILSVTAVG